MSLTVSAAITFSLDTGPRWTAFVGYGDTAGNFVIVLDNGMLVLP